MPSDDLRWRHLTDRVALARAAGHPHPEWFEPVPAAGTDLPPRPTKASFGARFLARLRA